MSPLPPGGTVERWAWDYLHATELSHKLSPPPVPDAWEDAPPARRVEAPGRPAVLVVADRGVRTPSAMALRSPGHRSRLFHTFLHHELQAAELMAWALLAFPDAPRAFRLGLVRVCRDEIRHMAMYQDHLRSLGSAFGEHPVRDWFWLRVPTAASPAHFAAVMGVGFEGANLDHTARFAAMLRAAGDEEGAVLQDTVRAEEVPHVRFAQRWLARWGIRDFAAWAEHLPAPLTPWVMRGRPINRADRARAGLDEAFLDALDGWTDVAPGC